MNYTPKIDPDYVMNLSMPRVLRPGPHGDGKPVVIAFAVPVYREVEFDTYLSHLTLATQWPFIAPSNWKLKLIPINGSPVGVVRNKLVRWAAARQATISTTGDPTFSLEHLSQAPADIIIGCDSDCCLPDPQNYLALIAAMLEAPADVALIGVPLPCRDSSKTGRINIGIMKGREREPWMEPLKLWEVETIGTGVFALRMDAIHMSASEPPAGKVSYPWFDFSAKTDLTDDELVSFAQIQSGHEYVGEDCRFCRALRKAGRRVMVTSIPGAAHIFAVPKTTEDVAIESRGRELVMKAFEEQRRQAQARNAFGGGFSNG